MDLLSLGKVGGTGAIILANGRTLPVNATGSYNVGTTATRLTLSGYQNGDNDGRGNSVRLSFLPNTVQPETLTGRILGQRVVE